MNSCYILTIPHGFGGVQPMGATPRASAHGRYDPWSIRESIGKWRSGVQNS